MALGLALLLLGLMALSPLAIIPPPGVVLGWLGDPQPFKGSITTPEFLPPLTRADRTASIDADWGAVKFQLTGLGGPSTCPDNVVANGRDLCGVAAFLTESPDHCLTARERRALVYAPSSYQASRAILHFPSRTTSVLRQADGAQQRLFVCMAWTPTFRAANTVAARRYLDRHAPNLNFSHLGPSASFVVSSCPMNCWRRGSCDPLTGTCICDTGYKGDDCLTTAPCTDYGVWDPAFHKCSKLGPLGIAVHEDQPSLQVADALEGTVSENLCGAKYRKGPKCSTLGSSSSFCDYHTGTCRCDLAKAAPVCNQCSDGFVGSSCDEPQCIQPDLGARSEFLGDFLAQGHGSFSAGGCYSNGLSTSNANTGINGCVKDGRRCECKWGWAGEFCHIDVAGSLSGGWSMVDDDHTYHSGYGFGTLSLKLLRPAMEWPVGPVFIGGLPKDSAALSARCGAVTATILAFDITGGLLTDQPSTGVGICDEGRRPIIVAWPNGTLHGRDGARVYDFGIASHPTSYPDVTNTVNIITNPACWEAARTAALLRVQTDGSVPGGPGDATLASRMAGLVSDASSSPSATWTTADSASSFPCASLLSVRWDTCRNEGGGSHNGKATGPIPFATAVHSPPSALHPCLIDADQPPNRADYQIVSVLDIEWE